MRIKMKNWSQKERKKAPMEAVESNYAVIWATHPDGRINTVNFKYYFEAMNKVEELWNGPDTLSLLKLERSEEFVN